MVYPHSFHGPFGEWRRPGREMSFGGGSCVLAGIAMGGSRAPGKNLIAVGRVLIAIAVIFFGVQHFLHPLGLPGVPLEKQMPTWIPARPFVDLYHFPSAVQRRCAELSDYGQQEAAGSNRITSRRSVQYRCVLMNREKLGCHM